MEESIVYINKQQFDRLLAEEDFHTGYGAEDYAKLKGIDDAIGFYDDLVLGRVFIKLKKQPFCYYCGQDIKC